MNDSWERISLAWSVALEYRRLNIDFDVVESPAWAAESLFLGLTSRVPVVVHVFSTAAEIYPNFGPMTRDRRLAVWLEQRLIRNAALVTGTRAQLDKVASMIDLPPEKTFELTCPIAPLGASPVPTSPPTAVFVGRYEGRKGPETVIRALPSVRAAVPDARLVMRGKDSEHPELGGYQQYLERLASDLHVRDAVTFDSRWGDYDEVLAVMRSATVTVVPSRWESFGYVAAEAGSLGRPVVASDIPSLAAIVEDGTTGLLAPVDDPGAWAEALIAILGSPDRAKAMGRDAAARMRTHHDPGTVAARTIDAYAHAIERFKGRHR